MIARGDGFGQEAAGYRMAALEGQFWGWQACTDLSDG
jgi:hypothetical protein